MLDGCEKLIVEMRDLGLGRLTRRLELVHCDQEAMLRGAVSPTEGEERGGQGEGDDTDDGPGNNA